MTIMMVKAWCFSLRQFAAPRLLNYFSKGINLRRRNESSQTKTIFYYCTKVQRKLKKKGKSHSKPPFTQTRFTPTAVYTTNHGLHPQPVAPTTVYTKHHLYQPTAIRRIHQPPLAPTMVCTNEGLRQPQLTVKEPLQQLRFTHTAVHTKHGLHQSRFKPTTIYTNHSLHQPPFPPINTPTTVYTNHDLHQPPFTPTTVYTNHCLHRPPFTPTRVYTNPPLFSTVTTALPQTTFTSATLHAPSHPVVLQH